MPLVTLEDEIEIRQPAGEVVLYLWDLERLPSYLPGFRWISTQPAATSAWPRRGGELTAGLELGPLRVRARFSFALTDDGFRLRMISGPGLARFEQRFSVRPVSSESSRVTSTRRYRLPGLAAWFLPLLRPMLQKSVRSGLLRIEARLSELQSARIQVA